MGYENIILIGMPGSGKTTIGRLLATKLNYHFIDTDQYIEQHAQKSLQQILDEGGIDHFCDLEREYVLELLPLSEYVIAPGGSVIYSQDLMSHLKDAGIMVFLSVNLKEIQQRLENKETRGIVGLKDASLGALYEERVPLYIKNADVVISCTGKTPAQIIDEIVKEIGKERL